MGWTAGVLPVLWAQVVAATSTTGNPSALAPLALRRWSASLTLSSPESVPSLFGLWVWLGALGGLFADRRAVSGAERGRSGNSSMCRATRGSSPTPRGGSGRASRMVAAVVGLTVLSWTGSQSFAYNRDEGRDDVIQLTRARHLVELAFEQGVLAGLTPLRDVAGLGANLPMLIIATVLLFRAAADVWGTAGSPSWAKGSAQARQLGPGQRRLDVRRAVDPVPAGLARQRPERAAAGRLPDDRGGWSSRR